MTPPSSDQSHEDVEGFSLLDLDPGVVLRIDFEDQPDRVGPSHAVLYRHREYPDELLLITSSAGTPGITRLFGPLPLMVAGCYLDLVWQDVYGMGWRISGVIQQIAATGDTRQKLPLPLRQQLGMLDEATNVFSLVNRRRS